MPLIGTRGAASGRGFGRFGGAPTLFEFTTYTFTTGGGSGRSGASLASFQSAYSGQVWLNDYFTVPAPGVQRWIVPQTATYTITAVGAGGGAGGGATTSKGASITVSGPLVAGTYLYMVVGQMGSNGSHSGGGGGGTFVWNNMAAYNAYSAEDLVVAAGGGGGSNSSSSPSQGINATTAQLGTYGGGNAATSSWTRWGAGYAGLQEQVQNDGRNWAGGPGAGWLTRPPRPEDTPPVGSYSNTLNPNGSALGGNSGLVGQYEYFTSVVGSGSQLGGAWIGGTYGIPEGGHGGFGGGGGGSSNCGGSGGGGGYSGGNGSGCSSISGGGGSFGRTTGGWSTTSATIAPSTAHGYVTVTKV